MDKKIFMNEETMKKIREERRGHAQHMHNHIQNEIRLFTDKNEMVTFVNQLKDIENVDIFKIEDNLYKVLISRKKHHEGCCRNHQE